MGLAVDRQIEPSRSPSRRVWNANATMRNEPPTNTEMNVVSFVANEAATSAPMIAGPYQVGRSRKRKIATIRASVSAAK